MSVEYDLLVGRDIEFPKIFVAIFSAETIVFGLAVVAGRTGFWPTAYAQADQYFNTDETGRARVWPFRAFTALERRIAVAMFVFLVLINQAEVGIIVRLNFFNRDLFNAIQTRDAATFWQQHAEGLRPCPTLPSGSRRHRRVAGQLVPR